MTRIATIVLAAIAVGLRVMESARGIGRAHV